MTVSTGSGGGIVPRVLHPAKDRGSGCISPLVLEGALCPECFILLVTDSVASVPLALMGQRCLRRRCPVQWCLERRCPVQRCLEWRCPVQQCLERRCPVQRCLERRCPVQRCL
ncbi:hypothetical protein NDU88_002590 [Pleurodeles waltl]|uniref:Uncharacterized protein n=1 Tax=Pleurodeles waltl TaxID=8319 RepID=A0AAV7MS50_PLEWA|nr:hypothetical protein NDU88_002590 [Pleurodeles waltl]